MALKQLLIDQGDLFRQRLIEPDYTLPQGTNTAPLITKRLLILLGKLKFWCRPQEQ